MIITTMGLMLGRKTSSLKVTCGVIEFAGNYTLRMYTRVNGDILTQANLNARWPEVSMSLPDAHQAQTTSVELRILSRANCSSLLFRHRMNINVYFQRNDIGGSMLVLSEAEVVFVTNFTDVTRQFSVISLGCHIFDLDGSYQAVLESSVSGSPIIAASNIMPVTWSNGYALSSMAQSAFPCEGGITLIYTHPPCSGKDKIRLYSFRTLTDGSMAAPLERIYITESEADPDLTKKYFSCDLFNRSSSGFCFVYVSVTRRNVVSEQAQHCIPAYPNSVFPIDGGWSQWTSWTSCSVTCGTGKKSRFRMCNEPAPKHGGRFCAGDPVEWTPCELHCPEAIPRTPLHSPVFDPNCACGCTHSESKGHIIATGRCHGLSVWTVTAAHGHYFAFRFEYFSLNFTRQWVKIRDGASPSDVLMFSSSSSGYPMEILTTGAAIRVEFMTAYATPPQVAVFPKNATLPIHAHGFIASYETRAALVSSTVPVLFTYEKETVLGSMITIVGISVCAVVILAAVIFVIIQRTVVRRRVKYAMTTSGDSPAHQALNEHRVSSAQSSSPSSPGNAINVDMELPLTSKPHGRNAGSKTSRASSTSSSRSAKLKKHRTKSESTNGNNSPRSPPPRDVLTSPYGIEIIDTDEQKAIRNISPVRIKPPRPSQGSSSSNKNHPLTPVSPATKLDMLNKKRQEKRGKGVSANLDRDITGSSGSQKSGTPSTTKAEVNWPVSGFVMTALNDTAKSFNDRHKRSGPRPPSEEIPLLDSMTSSLESPSHFNNMVKSESTDSATTSFVRPPSKKLRRPTSLTESYSNESKPNHGQPGAPTDAPIIETQEVTPKPVQLSSSSNLTTKLPSSSSNSKRGVKPSQSQGSLANNRSGNKLKRSAFEERQTLLPKPDGQSPKLQRHESPHIVAGVGSREPQSPGRASKASSRGSKNTVSSPTRSINTPSEIEGLELEYDDFVEDDPLSYFDYEETQKLAFRGTEKIGKTPVEEEDEDEV
ncbi:unnamed protein product [Lymnaea stagnalis]|uniref:Uncharacterized protein n=1 Tax=Lymnaea stagnalis TaxID=6523 RepID=A0AAV2HUQ1_LYMST